MVGYGKIINSCCKCVLLHRDTTAALRTAEYSSDDGQMAIDLKTKSMIDEKLEIRSVEIFILYDYDAMSSEVTFLEIANHTIGLDHEDYKPVNFWDITGGLQIAVNHYLLLFHSANFYNVVKITNFLIQTLYWIKSEKCERFWLGEYFPVDIAIDTTNEESLRLEKFEDDLMLSFTHIEKGYKRKRGDRYFEKIIIKKNDWVLAANLALDDYFKVLREIVNGGEKDDETSLIMTDYYAVWKYVSQLPENSKGATT